METSIERIRKKILPVIQRYGVKKAGLFGSWARGESNSKSDIDILVEIVKDVSLFGFIELKLELEEVLGTHVDLVEYNTIKPLLRNRILKEEVVLYEKRN